MEPSLATFFLLPSSCAALSCDSLLLYSCDLLICDSIILVASLLNDAHLALLFLKVLGASTKSLSSSKNAIRAKERERESPSTSSFIVSGSEKILGNSFLIFLLPLSVSCPSSFFHAGSEMIASTSVFFSFWATLELSLLTLLAVFS